MWTMAKLTSLPHFYASSLHRLGVEHGFSLPISVIDLSADQLA